MNIYSNMIIIMINNNKLTVAILTLFLLFVILNKFEISLSL